METPQEYYENSNSHGSYQFTTLKDIVDEMMMERLEPDSYIKNTNRNLFVLHAKNGIKKMTKDTSACVLSIEITVGNDCYITVPQNFVSHVSVSLVLVDRSTGKRYLKPLDNNQSMITAIGYLQDDEAKILFDDKEKIITSDASNVYNIPHRSNEFISGSSNGGNAFLDTSELTEYGEFKVDEEKGKISFSDNIADREIVLEYLSDGLHLEYFGEGQIKVHKYIEEAVKAWTYYGCISKRQTVPANEKARANMEFRTLRFKAIKDLSGLDLRKISRAMRSKSKYL